MIAQCPAPPRQNKNPANTSKKTPKNSDQTPPALRHPTRRLEPNPNALSPTAAPKQSQRCSVKKVFLNISQNSHENLCQSLLFNKEGFSKFIKKEALAQVFSCEFCEIFKNIYFTEHLQATAFLWVYILF